MHYFSIKVTFLSQGQYFTQWLLEKTTNISFITLVCIFSPHPYIEIAINPICSGNITHFIYLGDTLLSTCWFFHTISQRCRKLCVLGCFSQLRDRGKKSGALGTAVMILTPKETKSTTVHKNQYTPQLQSQILHVMEVLLQQIASCRQTGCYTAHTRDTSRNSCLSRDSERKKKKKYIHTLLAHHLSSAVIPHKVGALHHQKQFASCPSRKRFRHTHRAPAWPRLQSSTSNSCDSKHF